ncbi:MAG: MBL fold metallo-hydrolase [Opitutales bacterium]
MSASFKILGSSSNGNCAFLSTGKTKVLVDAGFSARRIGQLLEAAGESIETIDAVFLTHEHKDHVQGMRGLARRSDLPVYANRDTADAVQSKISKPLNWKIFETGTRFRCGDLEVCAFALPHDAYDPVGFTFHWGLKDDLIEPRRGVGWVVDLGHVPEHVRRHLMGVDTLVIEANYDADMLERDERRPWPTKQRIRGRHGHLSNDAVFELLDGLDGNHILRQVYLAHLSKDCNAVDLVREKFAAMNGANGRFAVEVIDPAMGVVAAVAQAGV